jgi:hypothetical protein
MAAGHRRYGSDIGTWRKWIVFIKIITKKTLMMRLPATRAA